MAKKKEPVDDLVASLETARDMLSNAGDAANSLAFDSITAQCEAIHGRIVKLINAVAVANDRAAKRAARRAAAEARALEVEKRKAEKAAAIVARIDALKAKLDTL